MTTDPTAMRARLESRLKVLQGRLAEINETLREPEDDDLEEQAVDLDDDAVGKVGRHRWTPGGRRRAAFRTQSFSDTEKWREVGGRPG